MSAPENPKAREELERIEDALVESILEASGDALRQELTEAGGEPDALIAEVDSAIAGARSESARRRLETARREFEAWRASSEEITGPERDAARSRLEQIRTGDRRLDSKMMMAARKGEGLSESDLEALIEDMAELERLERGNDEE